MDRRLTSKQRRIDDILLMTEDLMQAIRVEAELLGEAVDNDEAKANEAKAAAAGMDHPMIDSEESRRGNSLRDMVDDEVKREKVMRTVEMAVIEFADMLYPYTKLVERHPCMPRNPHEGKVETNAYKEPEMWQIQMDVPCTMSVTTTTYLRILGQEYAVARVIEEYCALYLAEKQAWAAEKVAQISQKIAAAKDRRVTPVRRRGTSY